METATATAGEDTDEEPAWNCTVHPSVFFLLGTLILTTCATGMLCGAIMTDYWEEVTWDKTILNHLTTTNNNNHVNGGNSNNSTVLRLQWLLDGSVARVTTNTSSTHRVKDRDRASSDDVLVGFLVPMHGGIWTLCLTLTDEEILLLGRVGFPPVQQCVNYLAGGIDGVKGYEPRAAWQHRMQNLSISCALVCLIVLGSAALVGAFGVCHHQISAVLVTGVMYLLAASFALFTLMIIHFKRVHYRPRLLDSNTDDTVDGVITPHYYQHPSSGHLVHHTTANTHGGTDQLLPARVFSTSWSLDLGWGGVTLCIMTSVLWIFLSKIMRFNPISTMIQ